MKKHLVYSVTVVLMGLMAIIGVKESHSQELLVKNCSELITMAQTLEADLKNGRYRAGFRYTSRQHVTDP